MKEQIKDIFQLDEFDIEDVQTPDDIANAYHKGQAEYVTENTAKVSEILEPFPKYGQLKVKDEEGKEHFFLINKLWLKFTHHPLLLHYHPFESGCSGSNMTS